ncbi:MAG: site-2 protease family protein [Tsuneonella sp.]
MSETLLLALILIPCLVIAIVFHEVSHGWAALALGDPTAREQRRLTFNPIRHVDPFGTLILPGLLALTGAPVFGWAKPVPVNARRLDNPRFGMMAVAAAGPAMNFLLAALGAIALGLFAPSQAQMVLGQSGLPVIADAGGAMHVAGTALFDFMLINVFLGLFNLLPIPPFDGSHIVEGVLPRRAAAVYARLRPLGFVLVFVLLLIVPWLLPGAHILDRLLLPPANWVIDRFLMLTNWVAGA